MSRRPRLILPGFPHHVTHRGNRRAPIFRDDADRRFYLSKLALHSPRSDSASTSATEIQSSGVVPASVPDNRRPSQCGGFGRGPTRGKAEERREHSTYRRDWNSEETETRDPALPCQAILILSLTVS